MDDDGWFDKVIKYVNFVIKSYCYLTIPEILNLAYLSTKEFRGTGNRVCVCD